MEEPGVSRLRRMLAPLIDGLGCATSTTQCPFLSLELGRFGNIRHIIFRARVALKPLVSIYKNLSSYNRGTSYCAISKTMSTATFLVFIIAACLSFPAVRLPTSLPPLSSLLEQQTFHLSVLQSQTAQHCFCECGN